MVGARDSNRHTRWVALRTLCGVAALVGLFAMHGLASHGTLHTGHGGELLPTSAAIGHDHGAPDATMDMETIEERLLVALGQPGQPGQDLGLFGLCLAVLLIGIFAAILTGCFVRLLRTRGAATCSGGRPARARRERDPPCLFALSIQRC